MVEITNDDLDELRGLTPGTRTLAENTLRVVEKKLNQYKSVKVINKKYRLARGMILTLFPEVRDHERVLSAVQNMQLRRMREILNDKEGNQNQ